MLIQKKNLFIVLIWKPTLIQNIRFKVHKFKREVEEQLLRVCKTPACQPQGNLQSHAFCAPVKANKPLLHMLWQVRAYQPPWPLITKGPRTKLYLFRMYVVKMCRSLLEFRGCRIGSDQLTLNRVGLAVAGCPSGCLASSYINV